MLKRRESCRGMRARAGLAEVERRSCTPAKFAVKYGWPGGNYAAVAQGSALFSVAWEIMRYASRLEVVVCWESVFVSCSL